jgi:hypothetical protein
MALGGAALVDKLRGDELRSISNDVGTGQPAPEGAVRRARRTARHRGVECSAPDTRIRIDDHLIAREWFPTGTRLCVSGDRGAFSAACQVRAAAQLSSDVAVQSSDLSQRLSGQFRRS